MTDVEANVEHVRRGYWQFGDIVRVDWDTIAKDPKRATKPDRDDRRWMVLVPANISANRQWTIMSLDGPDPIVSHWSSMYGFEIVE